MSYLCRKGHKHKTQDGATNCGYCKRVNRKEALSTFQRVQKEEKDTFIKEFAEMRKNNNEK